MTQIVRCKQCSSSSFYRCNKWWLTWLPILTLSIIRPNRWQCYNKCSKWWLWCRKWWSTISNNSRPNSSSNSKLRRNRTLKITCFRICSKPQHNLVLHHTSTHLFLTKILKGSNNKALSTPLGESLKVRRIPNPRLILSGSLDPQWLPNSSRHPITRLICLIDYVNFIYKLHFYS